MLRTPRGSDAREVEQEDGGVSVHESDVDDDERGAASAWDDRRAAFEDDDDEPELEDLVLDDLYAMEGPDA